MIRRGFVAGVALSAACVGDSHDLLERELARREQRFEAAAQRGGVSDSAPVARWILPASMSEVSGLTIGPHGQLFAHDDERGVVSAIDPARGVVLKQFRLTGAPHDDFEGITTIADSLAMVTSHGRIYVFGEGEDGASVPFHAFDTRLGKECEFEGIVYDAAHSQLLLPCKRVQEKDLRDDLVLYRVAWPLSRSTAPELYHIPLHGVVKKGVHPTDITRDPRTGAFLLVAAPERVLIELSPEAALVRVLPLPRGHVQAEGIAVRPDGVLVVSDEAQSRPATLTLYRWPLTRSDSI